MGGNGGGGTASPTNTNPYDYTPPASNYPAFNYYG
jgi:hypothetical protein